MKTAKFLSLSIVVMALFALVISGCQKDTISEGDSESVERLSIDENQVSAIDDDLMNDVDQILTKSKKKYFPCNTTIDSMNIVVDTTIFYVTFHGLNCHQTLTRNGQMVIRIESSTNWLQPGAVVRVIYDNILVTRVSDGAWIILNGERSLENVSGGAIIDLGNTTSAIVHEADGYIDITFMDSTDLTWNITRRKIFTGLPHDLTLTLQGFGTSGSYSNLVLWGVDRQNQPFYTQILQPVVIKESCGWDPVSGVKKHELPNSNKHATLTFGFDINNQPILPGTCPDKFKLEWYDNGNFGTFFLFL